LLDGTLDAIVSQHTPVRPDDKAEPFALATAGRTAYPTLWQDIQRVAMLHRIELLPLLARWSVPAALQPCLPAPLPRWRAVAGAGLL
jgi:hypothetical protein